ncbi:cbb3-type cytochrome c oxidase N-terminal domain-containing protein [Neolewinella persica]|uniref:cbb3-type cytochrome c oxidase N-terminal domain-containing protein n=1 Tax=Neolewinella persica TaxID=70998 RepID=UPI00036B2A8F|nr:cbb3-type cytochrome c oxidase N-terminal domain-containing protein [Neolewinella persica]
MKVFSINFLLQATPAPETVVGGPLGGMSVLEQLLFTLIILVVLGGGLAIINLSSTMLKLQQARLLASTNPDLIKEVGLENLTKPTSWWDELMKKLTDRVPIEKEASIVLDHDYDGVRELDNNLPPWWKGLFYASIVFAPIYLYFNHFADSAASTQELYAMEMAEAEEDVKAFLATQKNAIDESNVILLADADALSNGNIIFQSKCAVCHGKEGEGGIGPNLTDEYWIHGGSIIDVFKTIKHGVPEKGMIAWKNDLRARDMQEVASFILGLVGTNPPNPKEAQGELYIISVEEPEGAEESK